MNEIYLNTYTATLYTEVNKTATLLCPEMGMGAVMILDNLQDPTYWLLNELNVVGKNVFND